MVVKTKDKFTNYWWNTLFIISIFNIIFLINYSQNGYNSDFQKKITLLAMIYTIVGAIRSTFPVRNVERVCFHNKYGFTPMTDRIIATIAEISYILLLTSISKNLVNDTTKSQTQLLILNVIIRYLYWFRFQ